MNSAFNKFKKQLQDVNYTDKQINNLYSDISESAEFVLLDIYGNSELIKRKLINYLTEDYGNLYACRCEKPRFPSKKNKLKYIADTFDYELSLLSVIAPFMRSRSPKAKKVVRYIKNNIESHVPEAAKSLEELKHYSAKNLTDSSKFRRKFFTILFEAVLKQIQD
jgi:hypothetical protein